MGPPASATARSAQGRCGAGGTFSAMWTMKREFEPQRSNASSCTPQACLPARGGEAALPSHCVRVAVNRCFADGRRFDLTHNPSWNIPYESTRPSGNRVFDHDQERRLRDAGTRLQDGPGAPTCTSPADKSPRTRRQAHAWTALHTPGPSLRKSFNRALQGTGRLPRETAH